MATPNEERFPLPSMGTDPQSVRQRVEAMEKVLERIFVIPGINKPVGLDVILDLIPGIGDVAAAALGAYIVWEARNLGMIAVTRRPPIAFSSASTCSGKSGPGSITATSASPIR